MTDSRLAQTSNGDLAALIETCIYHSFFDYNTTIISQYVPKAQTLITLIDWTENERTKIFVEAGIGEVSAPQEAIANGIIYGATDNEIEGFHSESPTEYPNLILLRMIVDVQYPE